MLWIKLQIKSKTLVVFTLKFKQKGWAPDMKKVLLLLANGFEAFEASVFADVIGWNKLEGDLNTELLTTGLHEEIKSTVGFAVKRELRISEINVDEFDALAIPGGFEEKGYYDDAFHEELANALVKILYNGKIVKTGGKELALELEEKGYDWIKNGEEC